MTLEEGDIVLCTVDRIIGTVVFVNIDGNGEGTIITSEIAPGRIRNLRDYVVPKKRIVCKVLRVEGGRINLSLRRVTQKEQKEIIEQYKQEQSYQAVFSTILGKEKTKEIIEKIKTTERFYDFVEEAKEAPKELEKIVGKKDAEKILEILKTRKKKIALIKKQLNLSSQEPNGIELVKEILGKIKDAKIIYISAGKYTIETEAENMKDADTKMKNLVDNLEKSAKKNNMEFAIKELKK